MAEQPDAADPATGQRVQAARLLRGLSQQQLADRAHVSKSLVKKVELGRKPASPYFVRSVARVLRVPPSELHDPAAHPEVWHVDLSELERAVLSGWVIASDGPSIPLAEVASRTEDLMPVRKAGQYDRLAAELPGLLADIHETVMCCDDRDERRRANRVLAVALEHAAGCLNVLGSDIAPAATDAGVRAAELGDDPVFACVIRLMGTEALMRRGATEAASLIAHELRLVIEQEGGDTVATRSARGFAHLRSAIADARIGDTGWSARHLDHARDLAERVPPDGNSLGVSFTMDNVNIHRVAVAVESGKAEQALAGSVPLGPAVTPKRRAHHHTDLARAHLMVGHDADALSELYSARDAAPLFTRSSAQVHRTVGRLAETDRRRSDALIKFAGWAGVAV